MTALRRVLEERGQPYVLAVRSNHCLRFIGEDGFVKTDPATLADALDAKAWSPHAAGEGSKGLRLYDWARVGLPWTGDPEHCRFDAVSDDQAKEILTTLNEASEMEWESCEDSDCDPAAYDETLMLEKWSGDWSDATAGWAAVAEEIVLPSQMPYSGHAIVFVNKVAALRKEGAYHDAIETLEVLIREANKLCGR